MTRAPIENKTKVDKFFKRSFLPRTQNVMMKTTLAFLTLGPKPGEFLFQIV